MISTSCVLRSVLRAISRTALSYGALPSAAAPLTPADLDRFRERADRFIAELDEEFYLHYAGLKETLELAPIYERYSELTRLEQAQALGQAANGDWGIRELWRFAAEGYLSDLTRDQAEKIASSRRASRRRSTARRSPSGCCGRRWRTSPTATSGSRSTGSGSS